METYEVLHTMWVVPCIVAPSYPRAMRTRVVPLDHKGPGALLSNPA
jgi:hypothetical protein